MISNEDLKQIEKWVADYFGWKYVVTRKREYGTHNNKITGCMITLQELSEWYHLDEGEVRVNLLPNERLNKVVAWLSIKDLDWNNPLHVKEFQLKW